MGLVTVHSEMGKRLRMKCPCHMGRDGKLEIANGPLRIPNKRTQNGCVATDQRRYALFTFFRPGCLSSYQRSFFLDQFGLVFFGEQRRPSAGVPEQHGLLFFEKSLAD